MKSTTIRIERMYVGLPDEWKEISEEEFLCRTEWAGYWKKGTALQTLEDCAESGATFRTPWAFYRIRKEAVEGFVDKAHLYEPELLPPLYCTCGDPVEPGDTLCHGCRLDAMEKVSLREGRGPIVQQIDIAEALRPVPRGPWPQNHRDGLD